MTSYFGSNKYTIGSNMFLSYNSSKYIWASIDGARLSIDSGKTFKIINSIEGLYGAFNDSVAFSQKYVPSYDKYLIHKSVDFGQSWKPLYFIQNNDTGLLNSNIYLFNTINAKNGFILGDTLQGCHQIWRTENSGDTWLKVPCSDIKIFFKASSNLRYCNVGSCTFIISPQTFKTLFVSKNYGANWDSIPIVNNNIKSIVAISFSDSLNGLMTYKGNLQSDTLNYLMQTSNGGYTWKNLDMRGLSVIDYAQKSNNNLGYYIAQYNPTNSNIIDRGAFVSFNNGNTWKRLDSLFHIKFLYKDAESGISAVYKDNYTQLAIFTEFPFGFANINKEMKIKPAINIYPNPTYGNIFIESSENGNYEIYNISGQLLQKGNIIDNISSEISLEDFKQGLYFVKYYNSNFCSTYKIMVKE